MQQWRRATVETPGEWQCKTGGVRRLAVANGPNIFQMFLVQFTCLMVFLHNLSPVLVGIPPGLKPPLHTPHISSPNYYLLFTTYASTITTCFVAVPRDYVIYPSLSLVSLVGTIYLLP